MKTEEKLLTQIDRLINIADELINTRKPAPPNVISPPRINTELYHAWKSSSENLIGIVSTQNSSYYKNFCEETVKQGIPLNKVKAGKGILLALKTDLENGLISRIRESIVVELLSDYLDIAGDLLKQGYKDPAASLIGATLEDGLRRLCGANNIQVKASDDIAALNTKLSNKDVYSRLTQRKIHAWKSLRDSADHGKFSEYKTEDVEDMLRGVGRFLEENLG